MHGVTREQIEAAGPWFQRITFPDGTEVGCWCTQETVSRLTAGIGLGGLAVLDVGCMAGAMSLYCEEAGATVTGCEPDPRYLMQATLVMKAFGSSMELVPLSVFDMSPFRGWNVALLSGVYYHLQDPLGGIRAAWELCSNVLCIEGEIMAGAEPTARFVLGEHKGDGSNWWIPTERCLLDWCATLGGKIENLTTDADRERERALVRVWRT